MNDSWMADHFWCNTCYRVVPTLPWNKEVVTILGSKFDAIKCQGCSQVTTYKHVEGKCVYPDS